MTEYIANTGIKNTEEDILEYAQIEALKDKKNNIISTVEISRHGKKKKATEYLITLFNGKKIKYCFPFAGEPNLKWYTKKSFEKKVCDDIKYYLTSCFWHTPQRENYHEYRWFNSKSVLIVKEARLEKLSKLTTEIQKIAERVKQKPTDKEFDELIMKFPKHLRQVAANHCWHKTKKEIEQILADIELMKNTEGGN